jgi:expansin
VARALGVGFVLIAAACLMPACGDDPGEDDDGSNYVYSTALKNGVATYYDADGSGNCSFEKTGDLDVVAINTPEYGGSAACGGCINVRGPLGDVTVRVVDRCPECPTGHLDLSREAFAKIAEPKQGKVPITYQNVACDVKGNLAYHFKDGSSKYWVAIQVRNHPVPIAKLEYQKSGKFIAMKRENYNYFVESAGVGDIASLVLRVTAADGNTVEDTLPGKIEANTLVQGKAQFR